MKQMLKNIYPLKSSKIHLLIYDKALNEFAARFTKNLGISQLLSSGKYWGTASVVH